jgi:uncharacterized protein (DUF1330 family)
MPAYLFMDIAWHDANRAAEYRKLLGPTLEKYGGRTLVANEGGMLEGEWAPHRVVIFEFPTADALREWYGSPEYAPVMRLRKEGSKANLIVVERPPSV